MQGERLKIRLVHFLNETTAFLHILSRGDTMKLQNDKPYLISIAIPLAVGAAASFFTMAGLPYYNMQEKPFFSPPNALFPIVWTVLYILMGISAARIWKSGDLNQWKALKTYAFQLIINFLWSVLFFGLQQYFLAFLWLLLLIGMVAKMIKEFAQIDPLAAKLQIPYLLWCIFAAILNFGVWWLNR